VQHETSDESKLVCLGGKNAHLGWRSKLKAFLPVIVGSPQNRAPGNTQSCIARS
jgi:hypothetical protein